MRPIYHVRSLNPLAPVLQASCSCTSSQIRCGLTKNLRVMKWSAAQEQLIKKWKRLELVLSDVVAWAEALPPVHTLLRE